MIRSAKSAGLILKILDFARRELFRRALPHGLISPRYLLPGCSQSIKIHRLLWRHAIPRIPRPVFFVMEGMLWLRWVFFSAWRSSFRVVRRRGPNVLEREGLGLCSQFGRVLSMTLLYTIPPLEIYAFQLYGRDRHSRVWEYVFTHEVQAFHRWRSSNRPGYDNAARTLGDKRISACILEKNGVPVVPDLKMIRRGDDVDVSTCLKAYPKLFCKPRKGSAGRGCFVVEGSSTSENLTVYKTRSGAMTRQTTWHCLQKAAALDDYLVQPLMENHPFLDRLCGSQDAVTIRIITELQDVNTVCIYSVVLEVPVQPEKRLDAKRKGKVHQAPFHVIIPVDKTSGEPIRLPGKRLPPSAEKHYKAVYSTMGRDPLPFWNTMKTSAYTAHFLFPDLHAVAWDYVVTPDGPFILEGNTGWGTRMPQMIEGGLLSDALA